MKLCIFMSNNENIAILVDEEQSPIRLEIVVCMKMEKKKKKLL